ncbi:MAG: glycosyltransferase family 2 protein [Candidatus Andersenbacteria bacterium]
MPQCDVIIPTYNSEPVLPATLTALWQQRLPPGWVLRLIISDDGSAADVVPVVERSSPPSPGSYLVVKGPHAGSAQARNRGLQAATGDIILFLGADIILRPGALLAHLEFHQQYPDPHQAALGFVTWDPRINPSPLMMWMTHGGQQNNYDALLGRRSADPRHFFYGAHLSLKREMVHNNHFAPQFTAYGWEDLELGRRLGARGLQLHVLHQARALHHHRYSVRAICHRQVLTGQSLAIYQKLHPAVALLPSLSRRRFYKQKIAIYLGGPLLLWLLTSILGEKLTFPRLFQNLTALYFWHGLHTDK